MSSRLLLLVLVGLLVAGALAAGRPQAATSLPPRLADVERATARWRTVGLVVGLAVAVAAARTGGLGRGIMLAGPLLALCVLLGVVVGELRVTAPPAGERTALLEVRRVGDYLPRRLAGTVLVAALLLSALLATTTAMGSTDDLGRDGRSLSYRCGDLLSGTAGPWAGSFYSLPLGAVVALGLLVAAVALRAVVHRPRQGADPVADDVLRRRAAQTVTAAAGLLVVVPLTGVALVTAAALRAAVGNGALDGVSCTPAGWQEAAAVLLLLAPVLLAVGVWCAGVLLGSTSAAVARR